MLSRSVLLVDGKPTFIRAIEHRGEPLAELRRLGFNAVWLAGMPTADLLAEARRQGIGLIARHPGRKRRCCRGDPVPALAPDRPRLRHGPRVGHGERVDGGSTSMRFANGRPR